MNLSMKWLSDFVNIGDVPIKDYCDMMTATGSKVEGFEVLGEDTSGVVVGRIIEITNHPDADKLVVCRVDVGADTPIRIVTGATNVFEGAVIPVCLDGGKVGGKAIKKGKLRGVESAGMLCSIGELGLTTHDMPDAVEDGILILNDSEIGMCGIGDDIKNVLMLNDTVVEFEITSNRPDCLSVIGLARETAAAYSRPWSVKTPEVKVCEGDSVNNYLKVDISAPELCKRYSARVVKNVKIAPSPLWLRMRLRAAGVRPINNIVDITNYVMLEYGQPMHAFDYSCLDGSQIIVREAYENEVYKSLNENNSDHSLKKGMLVIADEKKPVALAGVMGGANSEIKDSTVTVVFESASFLGGSVRTTSKSLGMRTESSSRFEKGIDPELTIPALERACELVNLLCAGDVVDGIIDVYPNKKEKTNLPLEADKINRFLGVNLDKPYMIKVLTSLGFEMPDENTVTAPSWRADIECMNDLAEEIIRIYGYNKIESTLIYSNITQGRRTEKQQYDVNMRDALCGMGLNEINTFSFISPKFYDKINLPSDSAKRKSVVISNPLGEDTSVMRTTALPSMMEVLARNNNFNNENVSLYEMATVYIPTAEALLPIEKVEIIIGMYGKCDFYSIKGVVDALLESGSVAGHTYVAETTDPSFHPGRCAKIVSKEGAEIGIIGEIHPEAAGNYSISNTKVYAAVLDFDTVFALRNKEKQYVPLPKFPAVTRDFSFVCDESLEAGTVEAVMYKSGIKLLEKVRLFDVYRGSQIGGNKKSLSFTVTLRAPDRTLKDEEADSAVKKLLKTIESNLGITLRG